MKKNIIAGLLLFLAATLTVQDARADMLNDFLFGPYIPSERQRERDRRAAEHARERAMNAKLSEGVLVLKDFLDSAIAVRQRRMEKNDFGGENHHLEKVTGLLETVLFETSSGKDLQASWNQAIDSIKHLAALRNQEIFEYVNAAEQASSDEALATFIAQATILDHYIAEMDAQVDQREK